jgi:serine/threonine protein kinase/Tol biopolymer transport system component
MPASSLVGRTLGNYKVIALIGAGGMGEVYRAHDERLDRDVALKVLPADFCRDQSKLKRFEQEARTLAALNDPNLLAIYDIGAENGIPYIVSELLEGQNLRQRLIGGPLPFHRTIDFASQIVRGLVTAHEKRIVHRDLKPENIFVTNDNRVKILDFGVAKLAEPEPTGPGSDAVTLLTTSGVVLGTVGYMSPEQVRAQPVDHRSDIFSFGAIFYEMLTGKRAFQGPTTADTISAILKEEPEDLWKLNPNLPPATAHILRHCLEKRPEDRFQTARDLLFDLGTLSLSTGTTGVRMTPQARESSKGNRLWVWPLIALAGVAMLAAGWYFGRDRQSELPVYHQLTSRRGSVWAARFTSDPHTIVYGATWNGDETDIFTTRPESPESRALGFKDAGLLAVSSQGELAILLNRHGVTRFLDRGTLARVPLGGGAPREVLENVQQADWAPDGSDLAVVHHVENRERLEYPIGKVLVDTPGWITDLRVSPNGDRVAFLEHPTQWDDRGWVSMVDSAGHKQRISEEFASEQGLAWAPHGNEIWFTATRAGEAFALYAVTPSGKQRLVSRGPTFLLLHDIARDGSALIASDNYSTPVMALPPGQTAERDLSWLDEIGLFDLSNDGRMYLFQYYGEGSGTNYTSYLGKTDGSPVVRLGDGGAIALSPDGKWALTIMNQPRQAELLPTGPGQVRKLDRPGLDNEGDDTWTADGKDIVFGAREPGKGPRCYMQGIEGGHPTAITDIGFNRPLMSPNGKFLLAHGPEDRLVLFPQPGGGPQDVKGVGKDESVLRWSGDGHWLYVARRSRPAEIFQVDPLSGQRELIRKIEPADDAGIVGNLKICLSADAKSYVYSFERHLTQLFLVKGTK